ncbi:hypothetical protein MSKU9_2507 [Komagataeibacter diospyri]|uniref:Uncharacterized protein n=1 Tax=Komagataeibacter diospyri TaxID=1932662 RepID=A0A4P5P2H9_9PROT|nr:hypothetical protein MSKU9_2507 [Komagataeibacter diospyri]
MHGINFIGSASRYGYLPAAAQGNTDETALSQQPLLTDLGHKPDVTIANTDWRSHTSVSRNFNGLNLLLQDSRIVHEWENYA